MSVIDFTAREMEIVRDAVASMRHSMRGRWSLEIEAEVCAVQNRLRQIGDRGTR